MKFLNKNLKTKTRQVGGVLIFLLIAISAICMLMAYVIDLNAYYVRKTQADANAKIVALSALEEYYDLQKTCPTCNKNERLDKALARAQQVANQNLLLGDKAQNPELSEYDSSNSAILEPGIWERRSTECPNNEAPCFLKVERSSPQHPNAFRIAGRLFPEGSKNYFADTFLNMFSLGIQVEAVSSMVPRKGCFLVDISASTVRESHKEFVTYIMQSDGTLREEGYQCSNPPPNQPGCCPAVVNGGIEYAEFAYDIGYDTVGGGLPPILKAWNCMQRTFNRGENRDQNLHYKSDYESRDLLTNFDFNNFYAKYHPSPFSSNGFNHQFDRSPRYWIDRFNRPEPLRTIFTGIKEAISAFRQRAVGGDDLCLIFFDQSLDWPRVIRLNTAQDDVSLQEKFAYLEKLTDFDSDENFLEIIKHGMFPGYYSDTNVQQAIRYAMSEFNAASDPAKGGVPSSNFLVLISDGLANCRNCFGSEKANGMICQKRQVDVNCGQTFADHHFAMREVKALGKELSEQRIPLHVLLVGGQQQPNTMEIFNPSSGKCYTDKEYRSRAISSEDDPYGFVYGGPNDPTLKELEKYGIASFDSMRLMDLHNLFNSLLSANIFYARPNQIYDRVYRDFYEVAVQTGGVYAPLRPPCCAGPNCNPSTPNCTQDATPNVLRCDRDNRDVEAQVKAYLQEIISFNPYAVVYSK